ncbi:hypothetical protein ACI2KH_25155 [Roseomonas mucosa]|jgi:hypothetical protein|uniref:hypothetical protein n=1 Tax=Roseomonas mucosa TaxID=207340 RepID=UPI00384E92AE
MRRVLVVSAVLLAPMLAAAQPLPAQYVGPEGEAMPPGAFVSPPPGGGPFSNSPFSSAPFDNAPFQSEAVPRRWGEVPGRPSRPRAECVFAGQGYSEGAVVQAQGGEQRVCAVRPGATRDEEGNLPLSWQRTGG